MVITISKRVLYRETLDYIMSAIGCISTALVGPYFYFQTTLVGWCSRFIIYCVLGIQY